MPVPTHPYIHFQGNCAEAMTFYAALFGGTDLQMLPYARMPGGDARPGADTRMMHAQVTLGDGTLMASDYPPDQAGHPQQGFSVMQVAPDVPTARTWFEGLSVGGAIIHAFGATFFSPAFGMVRDRFGTHWIISAVPAA